MANGPRRRTRNAVVVLGVPELDQKLQQLGRVSTRNRIARRALNVAGKTLEQGIKSSAGPITRPTVKRSVATRRQLLRGGAVLRVGAGIRPTRGRRKGRTGGVGISARNIHWWILGTTGAQPRRGQQGPPRRTRTGKSTGITRPQDVGFLRQGYSASEAQFLRILRAEVMRGIETEAAKTQQRRSR